MNRAAQSLGRLGKGHKKTLTPAEIARRTAQVMAINARRKAAKALKTREVINA